MGHILILSFEAANTMLNIKHIFRISLTEGSEIKRICSYILLKFHCIWPSPKLHSNRYLNVSVSQIGHSCGHFIKISVKVLVNKSLCAKSQKGHQKLRRLSMGEREVHTPKGDSISRPNWKKKTKRGGGGQKWPILRLHI